MKNQQEEQRKLRKSLNERQEDPDQRKGSERGQAHWSWKVQEKKVMLSGFRGTPVLNPSQRPAPAQAWGLPHLPGPVSVHLRSMGSK